ncbi:MAG TPA: hypothetical protein VFN74_19050 [Chloroflexota bacterium]|jgi:Mrp family chromosome partitioning ATPase|nr:hypothetical protein [Chloroflexota bacterium]
MVAQVTALPTHTPNAARVPLVETPRAVPQTWVPGVTAAASDEVYRAIALQAGCTAPGVLAVASACAGDGKTTLALALASLTARDFPERRIAYVETDFARPMVATRLGTAANPGLLESLVRDQPLAAESMRPTALPNLDVIPAGGPDLAPNRWLCSTELAQAVMRLRQSHELVVLDLPALTTHSGAIALLEQSDRAVFVVRAGATPAPIARQALTYVPPSKLTGVVLTQATSHVPGAVRRLMGLA